MSTRAEFFQSMYPGLSDGEVIDELIKASIYGFEHGPEVVTISAAEGIHYVPYDAAMQKKSPYWEGTYKACNIPFTDFQIRYQPEQVRIVDGKRILEDSYDLLNQYAMKSLTIAPDNPKAYCWLIRSLKAQGMNELATNELAAAKEHLTTEEYEEILAFGANW